MIPDDLIITRRSSERPICRVTIEALVRSDTLFAIDTPSSMERWPYLRGSGRVFSSRSLLGLPRLLNKCVTNQFRMALARRQISLSFVSIIKLTTRMAAMHKITLSLVHEITLPAMRIEPTRPTTSTSRVHQVYRVSQDHQEAAAHLTA